MNQDPKKPNIPEEVEEAPSNYELHRAWEEEQAMFEQQWELDA